MLQRHYCYYCCAAGGHIVIIVFVIAEKYGENAPSAVLVYAGKEPLRFINIFPFWQTDTLPVSDFVVRIDLTVVLF